LLPQIDKLYIYLNGHATVPDCVTRDKVRYVWSKDNGDVGAAGKFYFLDKIKRGYYFSLDDDFLYPEDYVYRMIMALKKYRDQLPVCVHGSIFGCPLEWYFERLFVLGSTAHSVTDRFVQLLGTGTSAFHTDALPLSFKDFYPEVMCDAMFSIKAREYGLPIVSIARPAGWLINIADNSHSSDFQDYWTSMVLDDEGRTKLIQKYQWDYDSYKNIPTGFMQMIHPNVTEAFLQKYSFDIEFLKASNQDVIPYSWQIKNSRLFFLRKYQHLRRERLIESGGMLTRREEVLVDDGSSINQLLSKIRLLRKQF